MSNDVCLGFLQKVVFELFEILQFQIMPGIRLWSVFFYCLLASSFYTVFTRR